MQRSKINNKLFIFIKHTEIRKIETRTRKKHAKTSKTTIVTHHAHRRSTSRTINEKKASPNHPNDNRTSINFNRRPLESDHRLSTRIGAESLIARFQPPDRDCAPIIPQVRFHHYPEGRIGGYDPRIVP